MQNIIVDKPGQDKKIEVVLKKNTADVKQLNLVEWQKSNLAKLNAMPYYKNENRNLMLHNKRLTR